MKYLFTLCLLVFSLSASAQWQQTGSKVRYVNGLGIPTRDTAAGVAADSSQILIRPADSSLYIKYKRTWVKVGAGGTIGGSGTTNYIPKFTSSTAIGNSQIFDNGTSVGIGTASPIGKLSIVGTSTGVLDFNTDATRCDIQSYNKPLAINRQGNNTLLNEGGGFVGIGTASPATDLQISRAGSSTFRLTNTSNTTNVELGIATALGFVGTNTDNSFAINTNNTERVRVTNTGDVGIGTTSPAAKLSVQGTTLINTNTDNGVDKLQVNGNIYSSATIKAGTTTTNAIEVLAGSGKGIIINTTNTGSQDQMRLTFQQNGSDRAMWYYSDFANNCVMQTVTNEDMLFGSNNSAALWVKGSTQNVVISNSGTDNGTDKLQVTGSLSATGMKQNYVTKTGAYTATDADYVIDCTSGTFTVTLPASSGRSGRILIIKNSGTGTITVDGNAAETIDGAATYSLAVQYATIQIVSDGTNWKIISKF